MHSNRSETRTMKPTFDGEVRINSPDTDLARNVRQFLDTHRNGFQRVSIRSEKGTVRLSGHVGSFFLRQMAIAMAKRVAGVRHVVDDLKVDVPWQIACEPISDKHNLLDGCHTDSSPEAVRAAGR
jgi:osmotically-inducible protein OsmY